MLISETPISVTDCIGLINQTLEVAYPVVLVEGEVSSFNINKGKYVFFDIKDEESSLNCFMTVYQLRVPVEDGMRVAVLASPKLTAWGRFSLTIREIRPVGEGSIKRAFEMLLAKLQKEGLFDESRKRLLPELPQRIGVISSTQAAGYTDFITILNKRWSGMEISVANVQVQGLSSPGQIIKAIEFFNQMAEPVDVLVIIRGGGSADDLAGFNDELLVRSIAASRIPTMVGVGHEVDVTLADMAADLRAATPSNAAQLLVPDRRDLINTIDHKVRRMITNMEHGVEGLKRRVTDSQVYMMDRLVRQKENLTRQAEHLALVLRQLSPDAALRRGYSVVRDSSGKLVFRGADKLKAGDQLTIETLKAIIKAGVIDVNKRP